MPSRSSVTSRKDEIIETVLRLAAADAVEAISMQAIADEIGVTQPAIFRHFKNKEALWLAVMDWLEARLLRIFEASEAGDEEPSAVLGKMFLGHVKLIETHPALAKIVFADGLRRKYPSIQNRFDRIHREYVARLRKFVPEDAAVMFLCLIQGLAFQFSIARVSKNIRRIAEAQFRLYLRAIAPA